MSLQQKISEDLKAYLKSGESLAVQVLRGAVAAFKNRIIEKRSQGKDESLSDDDAVDILKKEAKKRREAIELYKKGGREDLASNEERELDIIVKYLPEQLSLEEIEKVVDEVLSGVDDKNFGNAMKAVMAKLGNRADGKLVSEVIRKKI